MNKQNNRLALSVLAALATGIALIYTLIMYHDIIFAVAGMSVLFLITAFILTQNLIAFSTMKSKSMNVHIKDCIDDISSQLEAINGSQSQIGKATYLYTKQTAQVITRLEDNYAESQMTLYKNLSSLSNLQNKATKLIIKYDQSNTTKLISTIKDLRNQLSETLIQGFDQIQPNSAEIISVLEDIVTYLKSQPDGINETMGLQLNNIAHELQNVSGQNDITDQAAAELSEPEDTSIPENDSSSATPTTDKNPNDMLSPDEIAALFAAAEPTPDKEKEASFTPTFTVVGKSEPEEERSSETHITSDVNTLDENPDKQLSPDEIAALFAAADPTPKKESSDTTDASAMNLSDDSNKKLSPDEIAALFESLG